jgi:NAD-dependent deacetylase
VIKKYREVEIIYDRESQFEGRCDQRSGIDPEQGRPNLFTGAGISADSGMPTYRGVGGLYKNQDTEEGVAIEVALSGPMFQSRPGLTWKYLLQIGSVCMSAEPNPAHRCIAALEQEKPDVHVMTQNVDGLHRRAGTRNLVEVHGNVYELYCTGCRQHYTPGDILDDYSGSGELPPRCGKCNGIVRPNIVLFEEMLPHDVSDKLERLSLMDFEMIFVVGTTAIFPYINYPVMNAAQRGIPTV